MNLQSVRGLAAAGLAIALAAGAAQAETPRAYLFAYHEAGPYGFVDASSVRPVGGRSEADILLVAPTAQPAGEKSHMTAHISMNCQSGQTYILSGQAYDNSDAPLGAPRQGSLTSPDDNVGALDDATRAIVCGGSGAPPEPHRFTTRAAAVAWVRAGAH